MNQTKLVQFDNNQIDERSQYLAYPPSHQGERAIILLKKLKEWCEERDHVMIELEESQNRIYDFVMCEDEDELFTSTHIEQDAESHQELAIRSAKIRAQLKAAHMDTQNLYTRFQELDEMISEAQNELTGTYDSYYLNFIFHNGNDDEEEVENETLKKDGDAEANEVDHEFNEDGILTAVGGGKGAGVAGAGNAVVSYDVLFKAIKDPSIIHMSKKLMHSVRLIEKIQSLFRGKRVRKGKKALARVRRLMDFHCLHHQFHYWSAYTRGENYNRKRLLKLGFSPLQGHANMATLKRAQFALHYSNARLISTMRRTFIMWYRYSKYLNAHVNEETKERLVSFPYQLDAWDEFLEGERKRLELQRAGSLLASGDPLLIKAFYVNRWRKYIRRRQVKAERLVHARNHYLRYSVSKHFYAWMDIVAFSSQREATNMATMQCFFTAWRRQCVKQKWENTRVPLLQPFKQLAVLTKWRQEAVALRRKRASANVALFANRRLILHALYSWNGDKVQQKFIEMWLRWIQYTRARRWFKLYVGLRWMKRMQYLQKCCFTAWRNYTSSIRRPAKGTGSNSSTASPGLTSPTTAGLPGSHHHQHGGGYHHSHGGTQNKNPFAPFDLLGNESTNEMVEEFQMLHHRHTCYRIMEKIHALSAKINGLAEESAAAQQKKAQTTGGSVEESGGSGMNSLNTSQQAATGGVAALSRSTESVTSSSTTPRKGVVEGASSSPLQVSKNTENLFGREVPIASTTQLKSEDQVRVFNYNKWWSAHMVTDFGGFVDTPLLRILLHLCVAKNKGRLSLSRSFRPPQPLPSIESQLEAEAAAAAAAGSPGGVSASGSPSESHSPKEHNRPKSHNDEWINQAIMCVGKPFFDAQKLELSVTALEEAVREEVSLATVTMAKKNAREKRILAKASARIQATKLYYINDAYTCTAMTSQDIGFSPYQMLMEEYQSICGKAVRKMAVPLQHVPLRRRLPYFLRLYMDSLLGGEGRENINKRTMLRLKVRKAMLMTHLAKIWLGFHQRGGETSSQQQTAAEKRLAFVERVSVCEEHFLKRNQHVSRYQKLIPTKYRTRIQLPPRPRVNIMNLLGFNPLFLRGDFKQKAKMQRKLKAEMQAQGDQMEELGIRDYRRTQSMIEGVKGIVERDRILTEDLSTRPHSAPIEDRSFFRADEELTPEDSFDRSALATELLDGENLDTVKQMHAMDKMGKISPVPSSGDEKDVADDKDGSPDADVEEKPVTVPDSASTGDVTTPVDSLAKTGDDGGVTAAQMMSFSVEEKRSSPTNSRPDSGGPGSVMSSPSLAQGKIDGTPSDNLLSGRSHLNTSHRSGSTDRGGSISEDDLLDGFDSSSKRSGLMEKGKLLDQRIKASAKGSKKATGGKHGHGKSHTMSVESIDLEGDYGDDVASPEKEKKPVKGKKSGGTTPHSTTKSSQDLRRRASTSTINASSRRHSTTSSSAHRSDPGAASVPRVSALSAPKVKPKVQIVSREERLKQMEDAAARRKLRRQQVLARTGRTESNDDDPMRPRTAEVGRLWESDDGTITAVEHLLELTGRFGAELSAKSTKELESLKERIYCLAKEMAGEGVVGDGVEDPTEVLARFRKKDPQAAALFDVLQGDQSNLLSEGSDEDESTSLEFRNRNEKYPNKCSSGGRLRKPLAPSHEVKYPYRPPGIFPQRSTTAPPGGNYSPQRSGSPDRNAVKLQLLQAQARLRPQTSKHHGLNLEKANIEEPLSVDEDPVRRQLLRVPKIRRAAGDGGGGDATKDQSIIQSEATHELMASTAMLINQFRSGELDDNEIPSTISSGDAQILRRHVRSSLSGEKPWKQQVARTEAPANSNRRNGDGETSGTNNSSVSRATRLRDAMGRSDAGTGSDARDFDSWLKAMVVRLVDVARHDEAKEDVTIQHQLLTRHLRKAEQNYEDASTRIEKDSIKKIIDNLYSRIDAVQELLELQPSKKMMEDTLFAATTEIRSFPGNAATATTTTRGSAPTTTTTTTSHYHESSAQQSAALRRAKALYQQQKSSGISGGSTMAKTALREGEPGGAPSTLNDVDVSKLVSFLVSQA